jgi:hypothetical protein
MQVFTDDALVIVDDQDPVGGKVGEHRNQP